MFEGEQRVHHIQADPSVPIHTGNFNTSLRINSKQTIASGGYVTRSDLAAQGVLVSGTSDPPIDFTGDPGEETSEE